jgi:crossover junction endodeoxyribonuclease RusA
MSDQAAGHSFVDPISGQTLSLVIDPGLDPVGVGIAHATCPMLADVVVHLDAFYCAHCGRNGRISGAWVADLIEQAQTAARTWTVDLGERRPISMNGQRGHPYAYAAAVRRLRRDAGWLTKAQNVPRLERVEIELHYAPKDHRRRDPMNLVPTRKAVEDGIVDAGVIPDDTPQYSRPAVPVVDEPTGKPGRLYVVIREITTIAQESEPMP